jgi:hypothetical protein
MNERIKLLAEQAGLGQERWNTTEQFNSFLARFSELIIRECMSINTQRLFSDYEGDTHRVAHNNALWCACGDMQEHFGVEE